MQNCLDSVITRISRLSLTIVLSASDLFLIELIFNCPIINRLTLEIRIFLNILKGSEFSHEESSFLPSFVPCRSLDKTKNEVSIESIKGSSAGTLEIPFKLDIQVVSGLSCIDRLEPNEIFSV